MSETLKRKRTIKYIPSNSEAVSDRLNKVLRGWEGIQDVKVDEKNRTITVEYDLWKVTFEEIEKRLKDAGLSLSKGLLRRWKRGWAKFTEQNELDNLKAKPSSCCHDPKDTGHGGCCPDNAK